MPEPPGCRRAINKQTKKVEKSDAVVPFTSEQLWNPHFYTDYMKKYNLSHECWEKLDALGVDSLKALTLLKDEQIASLQLKEIKKVQLLSVISDVKKGAFESVPVTKVFQTTVPPKPIKSFVCSETTTKRIHDISRWGSTIGGWQTYPGHAPTTVGTGKILFFVFR